MRAGSRIRVRQLLFRLAVAGLMPVVRPVVMDQTPLSEAETCPGGPGGGLGSGSTPQVSASGAGTQSSGFNVINGVGDCSGISIAYGSVSGTGGSGGRSPFGGGCTPVNGQNANGINATFNNCGPGAGGGGSVAYNGGGPAPWWQWRERHRDCAVCDMTISSARTIALGISSPTNQYGLVGQYMWPEAEANSTLDYSVDFTTPLADTGDSATIISVAASPSGIGELALTNLTVAGNLLTIYLSNPVAGRLYTLEVTITGSGTPARIYPFQILLPIDDNQATYPNPIAPTQAFGTPIVWAGGTVTAGAAIVNVATGLTGTGTNQAGAIQLGAQTNVFTSFPTGTGCQLMSFIVNGTIVIVNEDPTNYGLVYPPIWGPDRFKCHQRSSSNCTRSTA